jgi:hypothetical protein
LSSGVWRHRAPYLVLGCAFLITLAYLWTVLPARSAPRNDVAPTPSPTAHGDGLSDSHDGYLMQPVTMPTARGKARPLAFRILAPDGNPLTDYELIQTKLLHLYVLRDDLSGYQHLHPELTDGTWTTTLNVDDGGSYRVYAEFAPKGRGVLGHPTTLGLPFLIPGATKLAPLPAPAASSIGDRFTVTRLDGTAHLLAGKGTLLRFQITDAAGGPARALEPYLGSLGHMSAFDARNQSLTHVHAAIATATSASSDGTLFFHVQFNNRGEQRLFLEYQVGGSVRRAAFTVFVT